MSQQTSKQSHRYPNNPDTRPRPRRRKRTKSSPQSSEILTQKKPRSSDLDPNNADIESESGSVLSSDRNTESEIESESEFDFCTETQVTVQENEVPTMAETPSNQTFTQHSQQSLNLSQTDPSMHIQHNPIMYSTPLNVQPHIMHIPQPQLPQPQMQGLTDGDVVRIASQLKTMLTDEIDRLVSVKVEQAVAPLHNQLQQLKTENAELKRSMIEMEQKFIAKTDDLEQYSRRQCIRVSGINETPDENTTQIVLNLANKFKLGIEPGDIDRSHRIRRPNSTKPRDIIVKVSNYNARVSLLKGRASLRAAKEKIFINEDLTQLRQSLAYECRVLKKEEKIQKTWTFDGTVFIQDMASNKIRVYAAKDIEKFK